MAFLLCPPSWYYVIAVQKPSNILVRAAMTAHNYFPSFLTHCFFVSNTVEFNRFILFHLLLAKNVREENWKLILITSSVQKRTQNREKTTSGDY